MDSTPTTYVSTEDVAQTFGVSVKTVVLWIKDGKIRAVQPGGKNGAYRIPTSEVERLQATSAGAA